MPSRVGVAVILLFWAATAALVGYREVWPRWYSDGPPPLRIDLADEAARAVPAKWSVYRGDQKVGSLTTRMDYVEADDTFRFVNSYHDLKFDSAGVAVEAPTLEDTVRVTRTGDLRKQHMEGTLVVKIAGVELARSTAVVTGVVRDGQLVGRCAVKTPVGDLERDLDPVPVPAGQVLNPMMPVGRLRDVQPGRRWVIRAVNPLRDALGTLRQELAKQSPLAAGALPPPGDDELIAQVKSQPERLDRKGEPPADCWVIEYRSRDGVAARTWVSVTDGRVLRQEATGFGERLRFERDD